MATPGGPSSRFHLYGYEPSKALIHEALRTPDEIGRVLRVHLALEQQMNRLIDHIAGLPVSKSIRFHSKVVALRCANIEQRTCDILEAMNDLRNKFSHNPKATVANNKSIAQRIVDLAVEQLPLLPSLEIHFHEADRVLHRFDQLELGEKVVVVGAIFATYIGNMPDNWAFRIPDFARLRR